MTLVRSVMEPQVIVLTRDEPLLEALATLDAHDIGGAPVCDGSGRVVGVLSKTDLIARVNAASLDASVEEAMMPLVFAIGPDETLERAISMMAFEGVHRLVVLDEDRQLLGILTCMDVIRELAGVERQATRRKLPLSAAPK